MPRAGEVYWADYPDDTDRHLVIVVSRDELNNGHYVTVVPVTSASYEGRKNLPNCVPFRAGEACFNKDCVAQAENVGLLEIAYLDLDAGPQAVLTSVQIRALVHAIGYVIDSDCEPT